MGGYVTEYSGTMKVHILGFNVLYFDGSVKWWNNTNDVLVNNCTNGPGGSGEGDTGWYGNNTPMSSNTFWNVVSQK
jgi:prepilin-type processing-associated H-X9-DG protein